MALSELASPVERIEHHKNELIKAWSEAYGAPTVMRHEGSSHLNRYLMFIDEA